MTDVVRIVMELLQADPELMGMLGNNFNAICRTKSPNASISPAVEVSLLDDADENYYDNKPTTYSADVHVSITNTNSAIYDIGKRISDLLTDVGAERIRHSDRYDFNIDKYVKDMVYRLKVQA